jgi:putative membrane protein
MRRALLSPRGVSAILKTMIKLLLRWALLAGALLLVAHLYPGVTVKSFGAAMVAALVLGLLNSVVRPVLLLLTLPITVLTLGLFVFIINALMFWAAASLLDGLHVNGFVAALIGSLLYTLCAMAIDVVVERVTDRNA